MLSYYKFVSLVLELSILKHSAAIIKPNPLFAIYLFLSKNTHHKTDGLEIKIAQKVILFINN